MAVTVLRGADTGQTPISVDDSLNMMLVEICARCRRLKQREGLKIVVVDCVQLVMDTVSVAFHGHHSRFADMARGM